MHRTCFSSFLSPFGLFVQVLSRHPKYFTFLKWMQGFYEVREIYLGNYLNNPDSYPCSRIGLRAVTVNIWLYGYFIQVPVPYHVDLQSTI